MKPTILSGGQTGVDRAALDFALENNIPCHGWCPKGRLAEDGVIPDKYPLKETESEDYDARTIRNVEDSDGVLVIMDKDIDKGTQLASETAERLNKPVFTQDLSNDISQESFKEWLRSNEINILNIAGPRESNSPGIYRRTAIILERLFGG